MIVEKIHIFAAEQGSAEDVLGPVLPQASPPSWHTTEAIDYDVFVPPDEMTDSNIRPQSEQSPESAQLDALIASSGSNRIAEIVAVDRIVDPVVERGPIDVRIGGNHIKNPG